MCGRFAQHSQLDLFMHELDDTWSSDAATNDMATWNLAPSQSAWTIVGDAHKYIPLQMTWGLNPHWSKRNASKPINARVETAATKPYFRNAWRNGRCIVPADHYYEWQATSSGKQPYLICSAQPKPLLLAGLYEPQSDNVARSFAIVTTEAKGRIRDIHNRRPVFFRPQLARQWLMDKSQSDTLAQADSEIDDHTLKWHPIASLVNNPRNNGPELTKKVNLASAD